jgi:ligand-binding SRPBCC domain-containing protein
VSAAADTATPAARSPRGTRVLRASLWVAATPQQVWPFFSAAQNLRELVPAWLRFEIRQCPPQLGVGARIDYAIRLRGLPLRWRTRIARWEPGVCFADEQERGPYRHWLHTHTFEPHGGGTVVRDTVEFSVRGGPFAGWIRRMLVEPDLLRIFRHRLERIAQRFGGDVAGGSVRIDDAGAASP